jgi:hypothetical protein
MAREAAEQGTKIKSGEKNFDESLINALGLIGTAKLFGFEADREELENSAEWSDALASYEAGACQAWDEYAESDDCKAVLAAFEDQRNSELESLAEERHP